MTEEETLLRDAALNYVRGPTSGTFGARDALYEAAEQFAKSMEAPVATPLRVEPPEGTEGDTFHWLADEDRIEPFCWTLTGRWQGIGRSGNWTAETVADDGWRYHSVASPCKPDTRIEVSKEATDGQEWSGGVEQLGTDLIDLGRRLYDGLRVHFSPTQAAPKHDRECVKCGTWFTGEIVDDIEDDWLRQAIINRATRRFGKRTTGPTMKDART